MYRQPFYGAFYDAYGIRHKNIGHSKIKSRATELYIQENTFL